MKRPALIATGKPILIIAAVICLAAPVQSKATSVIDIGPGCCGVGSWGAFASYGQTFTVPTDNDLLLNYTIYTMTIGSAFPFVSQVYAWNGSGIVGSALYTSSIETTPPMGEVVYVPYTFNPSLPVVAGQQYIALVTNYLNGTSLGGAADRAGQMQLAGNTTNANPYSGGMFTFSYSDVDPATSLWSSSLQNSDARFRAEFCSAFPGGGSTGGCFPGPGPFPGPEPGTLALLALGLVGLGLTARRRLH